MLTEFRVTMPMTTDEYRVADLFTATEETSEAQGIQQILESRPYEGGAPLLGTKYTAGHYTKKINYFESQQDPVSRSPLLPPWECLDSVVETWDAHPYSKTVETVTQDVLKDTAITVRTFCCGDRGGHDNVHKLDREQLGMRKVIRIDIANPVQPWDYREDHDPTRFRSAKTGRGPLKDAPWVLTAEPVMTAYKLVTVEESCDDYDAGRMHLLPGRIEIRLMESQKNRITQFHRRMFCSMDRWIGLGMEEVRAIEERTREELEETREDKGSEEEEERETEKRELEVEAKHGKKRRG